MTPCNGKISSSIFPALHLPYLPLNNFKTITANFKLPRGDNCFYFYSLKNSFVEKKYMLPTFWKAISTILTKLYFSILLQKSKYKILACSKEIPLVLSIRSHPQAPLVALSSRKPLTFYFVFPGFSLERSWTHVFFHVLFLLLKNTFKFTYTIPHFSSTFSWCFLSHCINILLFL